MTASILSLLASAIGRRDEIPNHNLALSLAKNKNKEGIKEIVLNLKNKNKNIQSDCIKVLDDLSEVEPTLLLPHTKEILEQATGKNNRMQWGAMAILDNLASTNPDSIYTHLAVLIPVAEKGSVITKDRFMNLLLKLCAIKKYEEEAHELFMEQLLKSLPNQLPMYAEQASKIIQNNYKKRFKTILEERIKDIEKETKRKRIEKVIRVMQ